MKKVLAWVLRIACFAVIAAAVYTVIRCIPHIDDDYSEQAVMGDYQQTFAPEVPNTAPVQDLLTTDEVDENPTVTLSTDGMASMNNPTVTVTAAFGNIINNIVADLSWYVDGELVYEDQNHLLVEGSTVSYHASLEITEDTPEAVDVSLTVAFQDKTVDAEATLQVEPLENRDSVVVRTMEIPVTALRSSDIYKDEDLEDETGETMEKSDTGLMLDYASGDDGPGALRLRFSDGSEGWVDAGDMKISDEDCTTDEDYTEAQKQGFINSMHYDSNTSYLIWVSLYTQKVNVFSGYEDHWELEEVFDCSSGVNESPTTTGLYEIKSTQDRWDLGDTYVAPVLVFNGGEAFTSQPYDADTDKVADKTMGKPSSGGGVRLQEDDIEWMADNIPMNTLVVVY